MMHKFESIQLLRFTAALMVAVTHITFYLQTRINAEIEIWKIGSQGVQIFFVISGFVMMLASGSLSGHSICWRDFITQRLIRIVPAYWVLNILKLTVFFTFPAAIFAAPNFWNIFLSLLFIPSRNENGLVETFYGPGWTLNFEMLFYTIITISLFYKKNILKYSFFALVPFAILSLFRSDTWPAITYFCHPYVLNFLWGMILAYFLNKMAPRLEVCLASLLIGAYFVFLSPPSNTMAFGGVQYFLLVGGVVGLETFIAGKLPRLLIFGGDMSYSLYLTQAITGVAAAPAITLLGIESIFVASIFMLSLILVGSAAFYITIERPITTYLRGIHIASKKSKQRN